VQNPKLAMIEIHLYELLAAAGIFLFTLFCLNAILFKPFIRIMKEREARTTGQLEESERLLERYRRLSEDYENRVRKQKSESYRLQEQRRNEAIARRAQAIAETRKKADQMIADSRKEISTQMEKLKAPLESEARQIAVQIGRAILGREIG
jgi:F0F1-type ATP synthase membrane subunit b/b'